MVDKLDRFISPLNYMSPLPQRVTIFSTIQEENFELTIGRPIASSDELHNRALHGRRWHTILQRRNRNLTRQVWIKSSTNVNEPDHDPEGYYSDFDDILSSSPPDDPLYEPLLVEEILTIQEYDKFRADMWNRRSEGVVSLHWDWKENLDSYGWKIRLIFQTKENNSAQEPLRQNFWGPGCTKYILNPVPWVFGPPCKSTLMIQFYHTLNMLLKEKI